MTLYDKQNNIGSTKLIHSLILCMAFLFICHLVNLLLGKPSFNFDRLVHLDHEGNLPTWFSSALWAIAAVCAYCCSQRAQMKFEKRLWFVMALALLLLSIDEVAMLHEHVFGKMAGKVIRKYTGPKIWLKWPIIASPVILFTVFWFWRGLKKCLVGSKRCGVLLIAGVALLIFSACILETLHFYFESSVVLIEIEVILEEMGEMIGAFLIICGLLTHQKVLEDKLGSDKKMGI